jgi:competence protein ComEC
MLSLKAQEQIKKINKFLRWPIDEGWRRVFPPRFRSYARFLAGLFFLTSLLLIQLGKADNSRNSLKVYFFDVGQGDASLIKIGDFEILTDGGPNNKIVQKLGEVLPFYDREIELMILTHPHADHLTGLIEVLRRYKVKKIFYTGVIHTTDEYLAWLSEIQKQKIPVEIVKEGQVFILPLHSQSEAKLEILSPFYDLNGQRVLGKEEEEGGLNDTSVAFKFVYGEISFLFTGDISGRIEKELLSKLNQVDVLKVAHHGSRFATTKEFLEKIKPRYAVIEVGENRYGQPAFKTMWRLEQGGAKVFRTDRDGDIVFTTDGRKLSYELRPK